MRGSPRVGQRGRGLSGGRVSVPLPGGAEGVGGGVGPKSVLISASQGGSRGWIPLLGVGQGRSGALGGVQAVPLPWQLPSPNMAAQCLASRLHLAHAQNKFHFRPEPGGPGSGGGGGVSASGWWRRGGGGAGLGRSAEGPLQVRTDPPMTPPAGSSGTLGATLTPSGARGPFPPGMGVRERARGGRGMGRDWGEVLNERGGPDPRCGPSRRDPPQAFPRL